MSSQKRQYLENIVLKQEAISVQALYIHFGNVLQEVRADSPENSADICKPLTVNIRSKVARFCEMRTARNREKIIMVGPHPEGMGGISRVLKTWQTGGLLSKHNIEYIASVSDSSHSKSLFLVVSLCKLIVSCASGCRGVYVHTASRNSFYRKCIFLTIAFLCGKEAILHIHPSFFYSFLSSFRGLKKNLFQIT